MRHNNRRRNARKFSHADHYRQGAGAAAGKVRKRNKSQPKCARCGHGHEDHLPPAIGRGTMCVLCACPKFATEEQITLELALGKLAAGSSDYRKFTKMSAEEKAEGIREAYRKVKKILKEMK